MQRTESKAVFPHIEHPVLLIKTASTAFDEPVKLFHHAGGIGDRFADDHEDRFLDDPLRLIQKAAHDELYLCAVCRLKQHDRAVLIQKQRQGIYRIWAVLAEHILQPGTQQGTVDLSAAADQMDLIHPQICHDDAFADKAIKGLILHLRKILHTAGVIFLMQQETLLELAHGAALLITAHPVHLVRLGLGLLERRPHAFRAQGRSQQQIADAGANIGAHPEIQERFHHQQDLDITVIAADLMDERDAVETAAGHAQDDDLRTDLAVQAVSVAIVLSKSDDITVQFFPWQHVLERQLPVHVLIDDDDLVHLR